MIIGSNILFLKNLPSTNSHAALLLKNNRLQEGTIIYTNFQSAGKGHSGNNWESEDGKNLLFSIIVYPSFIKPSGQFYLSMSFSLGICDFLSRFTVNCTIKWPNDIYVKNDKIAGILIESTIIADQIDYSIAGMGLNINQEVFVSPAPNPVSLKQLTGETYNIESCLNQLSGDLDKRYKQLIAGYQADIKNEYEAKMYRQNEWSQFRDTKGSFTGKILSTGDYGRLRIVTRNNEIRDYDFKELEFIL
jgi:BirA family transcriptional regulator, biotin operon repressor / biotin---[acetyl-CoA-carboxylase] ligase